jgi:hypothetical protein
MSVVPLQSTLFRIRNMSKIWSAANSAEAARRKYNANKFSNVNMGSVL